MSVRIGAPVKSARSSSAAADAHEKGWKLKAPIALTLIEQVREKHSGLCEATETLALRDDLH